VAKIDLNKNSSFCICLIGVAIKLDNTSYNALSIHLERACLFKDS
jgi:hypothetical protein